MTKRELAGERVFVIDNFLTSDECAQHIARAEEVGFDDAPINTGFGMVISKGVRNNTRVMLDDAALAAELWPRLQPFLPARLKFWEPIGINERWRWYRYDKGEKFAPHLDGAFQRENGECSRLTFMVYLNDGFTGGATVFHEYEPEIVVQPVCGMALVFVHRQLHEGAPIVAGRKYVLRSDVMCRYSPPPEDASPPPTDEEEDALAFLKRNSLVKKDQRR